MQIKNNRPIIIWLLTGFFLVYLMVIIGGITRLTGSGLSMADWKPILGAIPPMNEAEWLDMFNLYKATPEFSIVNNDFTLQDFKSIFWWEFIHRDLGRLIGIVFIVPFMIFLIRKKFDKPLFPKMIFLLILGASQGLLGWFMVASGLDKVPHVSHYRLAAHLITALFVMMYILWVVLGLIYPKTRLKPKDNIKWYSIIMIGLLAVQTIYGAFVAGLKAGYGNHSLSSVVAMPYKFGNVLSYGPTVIFIHRYLAIAILVFAIFIWYKAKRLKVNKNWLKAANLVLFAIAIQFALGLLTLIYSVPVNLGVIHQSGAVLALSASIYLLHESRGQLG